MRDILKNWCLKQCNEKERNIETKLQEFEENKPLSPSSLAKTLLGFNSVRLHLGFTFCGKSATSLEGELKGRNSTACTTGKWADRDLGLLPGPPEQSDHHIL